MMQFKEKTLLTLVLLGFVGLILYLTRDFGRIARLVPFTVTILTLALLLVQLVLDLVPRLEKRYRRFEQSDIFGVKRYREKVRAGPKGMVERKPRSRRELSMLFWVLMMLVFIYLFGVLVALPLYVFIALKECSEEGWVLSVGTAAGTWSLLYVLSVLGLGARLHEGKLWTWIGL